MHTTENIHLTQPVAHCEAWEAHTEIVRVEVQDIAAALAEVNSASEDYDHTDTEKGEDVWGTTADGSEFRLLLTIA